MTARIEYTGVHGAYSPDDPYTLAINAHDTRITTIGGGTPTLTVAAQASTHRDTTVQLKDAAGTALAEKALVRVWISDAAAGALTAAVPAGHVSFTTGTTIITVTTDKAYDVVSDATGVIVVRLTDATGSINTTWYVNVAFGSHVVSAAVNITNA